MCSHGPHLDLNLTEPALDMWHLVCHHSKCSMCPARLSFPRKTCKFWLSQNSRGDSNGEVRFVIRDLEKISDIYRNYYFALFEKIGFSRGFTDHFSRLTIAHNTHNPPINDEFPEESLLLVENTPWYALIANYLATGELPEDWKAQDKKFFFAKLTPIIGKNPSCTNTVLIR